MRPARHSRGPSGDPVCGRSGAWPMRFPNRRVVRRAGRRPFEAKSGLRLDPRDGSPSLRAIGRPAGPTWLGAQRRCTPEFADAELSRLRAHESPAEASGLAAERRSSWRRRPSSRQGSPPI